MYMSFSGWHYIILYGIIKFAKYLTGIVLINKGRKEKTNQWRSLKRN